MTLAAGARIGSYEVGVLLGAGGMGEVYRAHDTRLNRDVALKILPGLFTNDPDRLARFHREAQLLASLNHQNIGHIYGFEESGATSALVLELVEGPTLADRIAGGALALDEALSIARQVADALEAAHEQGIIHRDLKPANVKIARDGTVKVLDFGLAKVLDPPGALADGMNSPTLTARATELGIIVGTAAYMAPEQARGKIVDRRADVWAFGVVLFEMLAGRRPFDGETTTDVIAAIVQRDPDWSLLSAQTPPRLRQLLRRCLEKDPRQRLRDIGDARLEIGDAIERKPDLGSSAATAVVAVPARWPLYVACAIAITSLAIAAAAWLIPHAAAPIVTRLDVATPPTSEPGSFALSPDGRQIVFSADVAGGVPHLWLRSLDQRAAKPLPGTEDGIEPFWAPNLRSIGFFATGRLKRFDLDTGVVQSLVSAPAPRGGAWNRDGIIVYAPNTTVGLSRISADGGAASELTHLTKGQYSHRWPHFLADGRRIIFSTFLGQRDSRGLFLTSIDGAEPRRILSGDEIGDAAPLYAAPGELLTLRQGVLFARPYDPDRGVGAGEPVVVAESVGNDSAMFRPAISASANGVLAHRTTGVERRQLEWIDRTGRVLGHVGPTDDNALAYPSLSPEEQRVAVSRADVDGNVDIWILDARRGTFTRVTSDPANDLAPLWSPDGTLMAFRTSRAGSFDLYLKSMAGTGGPETPLVADGRTKTALDWTPDSRTLLFGSLDPRNGGDLWAIDVAGDRKPYPVLRTPFDEMDAHISPDGRWMAYRSNESGRFEIYVRPFAPEGRTQVVQLISGAGGAQPRWNPNGKELFFVSPDGQMMAAPLEIAADRQSISSGTPVALFATHLASGTFITTAGTGARAQYAVTRDGRFLINTAAQDYVPPPISIVLNWDALLPKRR